MRRFGNKCYFRGVLDINVWNVGELFKNSKFGLEFMIWLNNCFRKNVLRESFVLLCKYIGVGKVRRREFGEEGIWWSLKIVLRYLNI